MPPRGAECLQARGPLFHCLIPRPVRRRHATCVPPHSCYTATVNSDYQAITPDGIPLYLLWPTNPRMYTYPLPSRLPSLLPCSPDRLTQIRISDAGCAFLHLLFFHYGKW